MVRGYVQCAVTEVTAAATMAAKKAFMVKWVEVTAL